MFKLSRRMQLIFDHLLPGKPVWDFCCDHGYLGLNAYESGLFSEVHFVDQVPHIVEQLEVRFQAEYFRDDALTQAGFHSRPGEDLQQPVSGTVVIAGVGAHTILKIVQSLTENGLLSADRLILGPQRDEQMLSDLLQKVLPNTFKTDCEMLSVEERGRNRKLLIFDKIL
ncbi:class I SAM-dependent methyltransferase [Bdellovibrio bacteriovorus]|uniref:class I SAM-dependent methyltransferase n=1 Tax=Bdellovibrio bacteriovorus TaxID=959 RepID=UPI0021D22E0E|nr:class I SAM-dependent methyltransferase [Bdellovibrio bacteriovorus]UXR64795.1 class I SAM-dependent methyltransferase [Bdellovibrio bacteriovorus]